MQGTDPFRKVTATQDFKVDTAEKAHYLFRVFPLAAGEAPQVHRLGGSGTIGRSPDDGNAIVVLDPLLSRVHAEFRRCSPGPYVFMDRGSKNGLFVDGARVTRRVAGDGSVVRVGGTVFVLREVGLDLPEPVAADVDFVGFSPSFRRAVEACSRVAPTTTTVLISGDTGTGKEVLARHVHDLSRRPGRFVAVNCAAVTPGLFESAMFGHRKGAFTGATGDFAGHARMAKGGTLFLDEIGELAPEVQAKLLRFLETGEVATVGDAAPVTVDVRVVAATNRDLLDAVEKGAFRRDLYARLAHWVVALPPLKERPEDVLLLAARALDPARLTADAAEALALHDWPFNVRELLAMTNEIRVRAPSMMEVAVAMLPEAVRSSVIPRRDEREDARAPSPADSVPGRAELESLLAECAGNVSEVARRLGKDRKQVYRWLGKHGLRATEG